MWWRATDANNPHDCTIEQLEEAVKGYFTADANPNSVSQTPGISGKVSKMLNDFLNIDRNIIFFFKVNYCKTTSIYAGERAEKSGC